MALINTLNMQKKSIYFLFQLLVFFCMLKATAQEDLFNLIRADATAETVQLLPEKMVFTQRLLWGEKGLLRKTNWAPLTLEQRENELKLRRKMLKVHQTIGFLTLAGMIAQGVLGTQLYNKKYELYETHKTIGNLTSISYYTGAGLSLFAPPPLTNNKNKGLSSAKAHKYLASLHFTAMTATNILAEHNKKLHRASAFTAFGAYAAAILVFKF